MPILKNLELYLKKIDYFLVFYFIFIILYNIKINQFYHIINISFATLIFFYGFFFKRKSYYFKIIIFFSLFFLLTIQSDYFHSKSLFFFYYFFIIFFASLIIIENFSIEQIIKTYSLICYILSIYAIYEFFNPFERFEIGNRLEPRADSIFSEPSHFASIIVPSLGYYLKDLKKNLLQSFIILIAGIVTFSITSYLLIFLIFTIYFLNFIKRFNKKLFITSILILFFLFLIILNLDLGLISDRYIFNLLNFFNLESINHNKNLTLWSVITSLKVSLYSIMNYPYGVGLGNFNLAYYDFLSEFFFDYDFLYGPNINQPGDSIYWFSKTLGFNSHGHSLLFRVFSEIGVFSFIFFGLFIYFVFSTFNQEKDLFAIYVVIIVFLIGKFLKVSSYFLFGTPIFLVLFIYLNIKSIMKKKFNKNLIYLPFIFMFVFLTSFYILNKFKNEKIYSVKIYGTLSASSYLLNINNLIRDNFKYLKPILIDIDHNNQRAILHLKYISNQKIELTKLDKFIKDKFLEFTNEARSNYISSEKDKTKKFFQNQLYDLSKLSQTDLFLSFFIDDKFLSDNKQKITDKKLQWIKNRIKRFGITDLEFVNNLANIYLDDQINENLHAKKIILIKNLIKSQLLFMNNNKHPNLLLSILINYYSNPSNMTSHLDARHKLYQLKIYENKTSLNLNINLYLISSIISIFTCVLLIFLIKNKKK